MRRIRDPLYGIDRGRTEDMVAMYGGFIGGLDAHVAREAEGGVFERMFKIWWHLRRRTTSEVSGDTGRPGYSSLGCFASAAFVLGSAQCGPLE